MKDHQGQLKVYEIEEEKFVFNNLAYGYVPLSVVLDCMELREIRDMTQTYPVYSFPGIYWSKIVNRPNERLFILICPWFRDLIRPYKNLGDFSGDGRNDLSEIKDTALKWNDPFAVRTQADLLLGLLDQQIFMAVSLVPPTFVLFFSFLFVAFRSVACVRSDLSHT